MIRMKYIDLTHTFVDNMPAFPGDPVTTLKQMTTIEQHGYIDHQLKTMMHVGTHMDAPLHMLEGGKYMSEIPVDHFMGPGVLLDARNTEVIDRDLLKGISIAQGSVVLALTGMEKKYKTPSYDTDYPPLTESFAHALVEARVSILGLDFINPDKPKDELYPVHKILLSEEILIIENLMNLESLVGVHNFEIYAFPMKLHAEAAPVRVVAKVA